MNAKKIETARRVGRAIARSVREDRSAPEWTGIEAQDADQFTAAGIDPHTAEWAEAERIAEAAYREAMYGPLLRSLQGEGTEQEQR